MNLLRTFLGGTALLVLTGCATLQAPPEPGAQAESGATTAESAATPAKYQGSLRPIPSTSTKATPVVPIAAPADLWDRIRRGFAMEDLEGDLVNQQEQWYSSRPDYIQRMTERSRKYLFHIVEELERRNMPTELALLPFIESAFNPQAVSSAKAAGIWQFMPATGTYFDLRQNIFRDDRHDVLASTRAALDYLQKLYGMFGDWHLALAAYNWGEGSVSRAIKRNEARDLGTSYTDLQMPNETRMYVPKLQAVKNIVARPDDFNTELPLIENHPYFQTVEIKRDIDIELVAKLADIGIEDFRALNPSIRTPVIFAAGTPQILLPWDNATVFQRNLQAYDDGQYASWTVWSVPSTMSVSQAAERVGMSENDLRQINNIPPRMLIKAGSALIVPRTTTRDVDVPLRLADNGQLSLTPELPPQRRATVKVRKGQTLAKLASQHGVSVQQIASWNKISAKARLKAGQSLVLYLPVRPATSAPASASNKATRGKATAAAPQPRRQAAPTKAPTRTAAAAGKPTPAGRGTKQARR